MLDRRGFLIGLGVAAATPAIVRASSLMPIRTPITMRPDRPLYLPCDGRLIRIKDYPELFNRVGHRYGSFIELVTEPRHWFALPDLRPYWIYGEKYDEASGWVICTRDVDPLGGKPGYWINHGDLLRTASMTPSPSWMETIPAGYVWPQLST